MFERATFTGLQFKNGKFALEYFWSRLECSVAYTLDPTSQTNFDILDSLIPRFISTLLPVDRANLPPLNYQLCINSLANAADIQLHLPFAPESVSSRIRILNAAKSILDLIDTWAHVPELEFIDPMLAVRTNGCYKCVQVTDDLVYSQIIWTIACKVFIDEILRLKGPGNPANLPFTLPEIVVFSKRVIGAMESHPFPLMSCVV